LGEGYGSPDADALTAATDTTLFQAASISKPVLRAGGFEKVEQGKLSLTATSASTSSPGSSRKTT